MRIKKNVLSIFIILSVLQIIISCKDDVQTKLPNIKGDITSDKDYSKKGIVFKLEFPDTVYVNQLNDGLINYKSPFDTIITVFGNEKKNRYTRFILTTTNDVDYDLKHLKQIVKDTFGALNNRSIPFYDIRFSKKGVYYIDGIIKDIVSIDTVTKPTKKDYLIRLLENEKRVTHKVIVIDNPK